MSVYRRRVHLASCPETERIIVFQKRTRGVGPTAVISIRISRGRNETLVPTLGVKRRLLGHAQLSMTAIYADAVGPEEHDIASKMWVTR